MTITEERLAEIEARLKAATPGPWVHYYSRLREQFSTMVREIQTANGRAVVQWAGFDGNAHARKNKANATFIAHSPTDIADLLAEVRRLREAQEATRNTTQEAEEVAGAIKANVMRALGVK